MRMGTVKKAAAVVATVAAVIGGGQAANGAVGTAPTVVRHVAPVATTCRSGYYKNVSGHCVHRPSTVRAGASARCRDGSYSYSEHRSGTCSYHGGVAVWYR